MIASGVLAAVQVNHEDSVGSENSCLDSAHTIGQKTDI